MNQRIHNLSKWRFLPEGRSIRYPGRAQRTVIVEVNCPQEVAFYIAQDFREVAADPERIREEEAGRLVPADIDASDGSVGGLELDERPIQFLGLCKGRDSLEFAVDGAFDLLVEGGPAYVFSADGQDLATRIVAPMIFTRIANRRQRNPHLEMMQYQMKLNQERLQAQLLEEMARREAALEERLESYAAQRDERAPPELVGKAAGRDSGTTGDSRPDNRPPEPSEDESGDGEEATGKRRKAKSASDV